MSNRLLVRGVACWLALGLLLSAGSQSICSLLCQIGVCCALPVESTSKCKACKGGNTSAATECCIGKLSLVRSDDSILADKSDCGELPIILTRCVAPPSPESAKDSAPRFTPETDRSPPSGHGRPDVPRAPPIG